MYQAKHSFLAKILIICTFILVFVIISKPTIFNEQLKSNYAAEFKSAYNNLHDFSLKINNKERNEIFASINKSCDYNTINGCKAFFAILKKHGADFEVSELNDYETMYLNQEMPFNIATGTIIKNIGSTALYNGYSINLKNGNMIFNYHFFRQPRLDRESEKFYGEAAYRYLGIFDIDINGTKLPNIYGRDIFRFLFLEDGTIYPYMGVNYTKSCRKYVLDGDNMSENTGVSCGAKIMAEGWKMNY